MLAGHPLQLHCTPGGPRPINRTWLFNGKEIKGERYVFLNGGDTFVVGQSNTDDAGTYTCRAANIYGMSEALAEVKVHSKWLSVFTSDIFSCYSFLWLHTVSFSCSVVRKMAQYMSDILDREDRERLHENLLVGPSKQPMETYVSRFQWDMAKYPLRQSLPNLVETISKNVSQIDSDLKQKSSSYNNLRGNLQAIKRKLE